MANGLWTKQEYTSPKNPNAINFLSQMERIKMYFLIINFNLKAQKWNLNHSNFRMKKKVHEKKEPWYERYMEHSSINSGAYFLINKTFKCFFRFSRNRKMEYFCPSLLLKNFFSTHLKNIYINIKYRKQLISKVSKSLLHSIALVFFSSFKLEVERVHCTLWII